MRTRLYLVAITAIAAGSAFVYFSTLRDAETQRLAKSYGLDPHQITLMRDCEKSMHSLGTHFENPKVGIEKGCACVAAAAGKAVGYGQFKAVAAALHFLMLPEQPLEKTLADAAQRYSVSAEGAKAQLEMSVAAVNYCSDLKNHGLVANPPVSQLAPPDGPPWAMPARYPARKAG